MYIKLYAIYVQCVRFVYQCTICAYVHAHIVWINYSSPKCKLK